MTGCFSDTIIMCQVGMTCEVPSPSLSLLHNILITGGSELSVSPLIVMLMCKHDVDGYAPCLNVVLVHIRCLYKQLKMVLSQVSW